MNLQHSVLNYAIYCHFFQFGRHFNHNMLVLVYSIRKGFLSKFKSLHKRPQVLSFSSARCKLLVTVRSIYLGIVFGANILQQPFFKPFIYKG